MADPASALSIASSVVQFIQFSVSLASQAKQIYDSAEGSLPEHIECDAASRRLAGLSERVKESVDTLEKGRGQSSRPIPTALGDICNRCIEISTELQTSL